MKNVTASQWINSVQSFPLQTEPRRQTPIFHRSQSPTKLGKVIEDLEHVLEPRKQSGLRRIVLPQGGTENVGETRPSQLKPPITP